MIDLIGVAGMILTGVLLWILAKQDKKTNHINLLIPFCAIFVGIILIVLEVLLNGRFSDFFVWLISITLSGVFFYLVIIIKVMKGTKKERIMFGGDFWVLMMIQALNPQLFILPSFIVYILGAFIMFFHCIYKNKSGYVPFVPYLLMGFCMIALFGLAL